MWNDRSGTLPGATNQGAFGSWMTKASDSVLEGARRLASGIQLAPAAVAVAARGAFSKHVPRIAAGLNEWREKIVLYVGVLFCWCDVVPVRWRP